MASSSSVPPGFRFHPTDEELLSYYLQKKVNFEKFDLDVIRDVDLNKLEPWDLQEWCRIDTTQQNDWYFFSHKDRKYPTGTRTNRATTAGFWKATGRDKAVNSTTIPQGGHKRIGMRKTLVFYRGRAPHGQKTDWIMHEYRLDDSNSKNNNGGEDGWVVCRVFKKRIHYHKSTTQQNTCPKSSDVLKGEQPISIQTQNVKRVLNCVQKQLQFPCKKEEFQDNDMGPSFLHLPQLESPKRTNLDGSFIVPNIFEYGNERRATTSNHKRIEPFATPFSSMAFTSLSASTIKPFPFGGDENILDNFIPENDQWDVLNTLSEDIKCNQIPDMINETCSKILPPTYDMDMWKPMM